MHLRASQHTVIAIYEYKHETFLSSLGFEVQNKKLY